MTNGTAPVLTEKTQKIDLKRDYVASGSLAWYPGAVRALPWGIDDIAVDFGDDVYDLMMHDPTVIASVNALRAGILEDGVKLVSAVTDEATDGYAQAQEILAFCTSVFDDLEMPLDDVLWDMLSAVALGNRVAEIVYELVAGKLVTSSIKVKPRRSTAFVVDPYMNVVGIAAVVPGQPWAVLTGMYFTDVNSSNLMPRDKFAVLTHRPRDNDPRGTSALRPAYNAWNLKRIAWPEYLKYLVQFASQGLVGYTADNAFPGDDGVSPEVKLANAMMSWHNGAVLALKYGSKFEVINPTGDGKAFLDAFQMFDRQIIHGILNQTLATMEGLHQSRAAAQTHQDVMDTLIRQGKKSVEWTVYRDILMPLVRYNYGDGALPLVPKATLGTTEQVDFATTATAIAALGRSGLIDPSQLPGIYEFLGLPPIVVSPTAPSSTPAQPQDTTGAAQGGQAA